jgi:hypothetical protein
VHSGLVVTVVVVALLTALAGAVAAVRNRPPGRVVLGVAALAELAVLVQSIVALVAIAGGERPPGTATSVAYLLGILVVLPLAAAWALVERTRWSGAVIAVGALAVAVMTVRVDQIWRGVGG